MHGIFKKNQILTLPNLLSVFRLALIPLIIWLYSVEQNYYAAIAVILLSGATDIVDGWIARRFNMVSDFGKILDPVADKLTQAALLICLISRYKLMLGLMITFAVTEISKLILGVVVIKKSDEINSARWYGKANTVIIYAVMMLLILFPGAHTTLANCLICLCGGFMVINLILYSIFYCSILRKKRSCRKGDEAK